ncbi:5-formyltetrahydrofolate cyclo-ligase [Xanthomonadaceae bacterium JHOS43]|nr:5-formyltetrahydrofolate cyclo-ligase [Xanthomonadaceae bacterium JHOS43]
MTSASDARMSLRAAMRERRLALPARERIAAADALAEQLRSLPELATSGHVAGYWAMQGEISLHALLSPAPRFIYCLPCLAPERHLRFAPWRFGDALVQNRYGIPEPDLSPESLLAPEAMDVVLVPLTAFDRHAVRLGAGGGYYDRSFAFLQAMPRPARPLLVGVGYDFQEAPEVPAEAWDVPMDVIVTDARILRRG